MEQLPERNSRFINAEQSTDLSMHEGKEPPKYSTRQNIKKSVEQDGGIRKEAKRVESTVKWQYVEWKRKEMDIARVKRIRSLEQGLKSAKVVPRSFLFVPVFL